MRVCFDLDKTLCAGYPYEEAEPLPGAIELLDALKSAGHTIIIYTARGMGSCSNDQGKAMHKIGLLTLNQLEDWDFKYDEIYFGKPAADLYIDDKAVPVLDYEELLALVIRASALQEMHSTLDKIDDLLTR